MIHSRRLKQESLLKRFCDPFEILLERPQPGFALLAAKRQVEAAMQATRKAMRQAKAADHAKASFLANMSHELRTPLNAIIGFSELIKLDQGQARGRHPEYAGYIYDAGVSLLELLTAILDLARIEAGEYDLEEELVPIGDVIAVSLQIIRPLAEEKSIFISCTNESPTALVAVDPIRIKQVLLNILSNAIKYTPADGRVMVDTRRHANGGLVIRIADSGIGIPPAQLRRVLEPFEQVEGALTRQIDGVGLGLPIARALMELHGGELTIDSEPGRGTAVALRLPGERLRSPLALVSE
ncbi:MAG TPA: HAMP domain-containing sensor histidine kinase [Stellaceae bacterium]|nr:HAMP domain-containing sensor histidine kinase [Stellaceae bacterium]